MAICVFPGSFLEVIYDLNAEHVMNIKRLELSFVLLMLPEFAKEHM